MKKNLTLTSLAVLTALYSTHATANLYQQCLLGVPHFTGEVLQGDANSQPIYIEADNAEVTYPSYTIYRGNVDIKQGMRHLVSDSAEVRQTGEDNERVAWIGGGFNYQDNQINLAGTNARIDLGNRDADIDGADYQLVDRQGRGSADVVVLRQDYRLMRNATFTSCLPNDNSWSVQATEMRQHIKEEYLEMWHARFKVAGVPIFYTPYLQLPIGDRRRSGLLIPETGMSNRDGYYYAQPFYWNIAPNYDATFTPKYMSHRGWQLNSNFRYLTPIGEGEVALEYLGKDRYKDYLSENRTRHLFYWNHSSAFLENWRLNIDYTRVSDRAYLTDFDSDYGKSTDGYADQYVRIAYYQPNYNFAISARQFQIFDDVDITPYRTLPQIDFNYYKNVLPNGMFDFKLFAQAVRFDNKNALMPTAWRFHAEPMVSTTWSNRYGSLNVEGKLYATHYDQKKGNHTNAEKVDSSINRVLPQIKVDLQTVLARDTTFIDGYTQTFEPRVQYLYRPYKDQSNIGSSLNSSYLGFGYDSSLLQQDYYSLFRDRRYSGLDRIASANQITVGGTTRFYDENAEERFNLSIGQIYYPIPSRIDSNSKNDTGHSSSWALESNWKINDFLHWHGSYQYDPQLKQVSLANTGIEFKFSQNNLIQLTYRYTSQEYIDQNLSASANRYGQDIKQLGVNFAWEISDNWAIVGRYYQDLALKKPVEQYLGVQYSTCCWSIALGGHRYATSKVNQQHDEVVYNNGISVNVELRGFGSPNNTIQKMLDKGKLPYLQAYSLY